jgi:hypothetical protein
MLRSTTQVLITLKFDDKKMDVKNGVDNNSHDNKSKRLVTRHGATVRRYDWRTAGPVSRRYEENAKGRDNT